MRILLLTLIGVLLTCSINAQVDSCFFSYSVDSQGYISLEGSFDGEPDCFKWTNGDGDVIGYETSFTYNPNMVADTVSICFATFNGLEMLCEYCADIPYGDFTPDCYISFDYSVSGDYTPDDSIQVWVSALEVDSIYWNLNSSGGFNMYQGTITSEEEWENFSMPFWPLDYEAELCVLGFATNGGSCSYCEFINLPYELVDCEIDFTYEEINGEVFIEAVQTGLGEAFYNISVDNIGVSNSSSGSIILEDGVYTVCVNANSMEGFCNHCDEITVGSGEEDCVIDDIIAFPTDSVGSDLSYFLAADFDMDTLSAPLNYTWLITDLASGQVSTFSSETLSLDFPVYSEYMISIEVVDANGLDCSLEEFLLLEDPNAPLPPDTLIVWPGDANNDGIANNEDLLSIGVAYSTNGIERSIQGINWNDYWALEWEDSFDDGLNYAYADCNGDGIINDDDFEAINQNYGETHGKTDSESEATLEDAPFYVDLPDQLNDGDFLQAPILLGEEENQVENFYGVAFTIEFDTEILDPNTIQFQLSDSWIADTEDLLSIKKLFKEAGKLEVAICRKDQENINGGGVIANLSAMVIFDSGADLNITISNVKAISYDEQAILLNTITTSSALNNTISIDNYQSKWSIYPNPAKDFIRVNGLEESATISLIDIHGRTILITENSQQLDLMDVADGVYFLSIQTDKENFTRKIVVD